MSARCNVFVKNIQSDDVAVRQAEVSGFIEFLNGIVEEGRAPLHDLGQGVCSNILYLLITSHVQPILSGKNALSRSSVSSAVGVERLNETVTGPLLSMFESIHANIPTGYPLMPLLWKSSGALRKVLEHVLMVLESETLGVKCGVVYSNLLRFILKFEAYQDVLTALEVNRSIRRLTGLLKYCRNEMEVGGPSRGISSSLGLGSAAALALCSVLGSRVSIQLLDDRAVLMQTLCELVEKFHSSDSSVNQPIQTDYKLQAFLLRAVRLLGAGTQWDDGACASKAGALVKPLLSLWHRTTKRDEWRLEVVQFVLGQLSFMFQGVISDARRSAVEGHSPSGAVVNTQSLFLLHRDIVPLAVGIFFPPRREQEYDGNGRLRLFPNSPGMQFYVELGSLITFLSTVTYNEFQRQMQVGDEEFSDETCAPMACHILESVNQLASNIRSGMRLNEMRDAALASVHLLSSPLTVAGFSDACIELAAERLLSCYPTPIPTLDVGVLSALTTLWPRLKADTLRSGWCAIAPQLFPSRVLWNSHRVVPTKEGCSSLLCLLHTLRSRGVFMLPFVEGFDLGKSALLTSSQDDGEIDSDGRGCFQTYLADFFVEASTFSVSPKDHDSGPSVPSLNGDDLTLYLTMGYGGVDAGVASPWESLGADRGVPGASRQPRKGQSLYQMSAEVVDSGADSVVDSLGSSAWSGRSVGDITQRMFSAPSILTQVLPGAHYISPLHRFCSYESSRLQLASLGKGSSGERVRAEFEARLKKESLFTLSSWWSPSVAHGLSYAYSVPEAVTQAIRVETVFVRHAGGDAFISLGKSSSSSGGAQGDANIYLLGSSVFTQNLFQWSQALYERHAFVVEQQEAFEQSFVEGSIPFSSVRLEGHPQRYVAYVRGVCQLIISSALSLRMLLNWQRSGAWQPSSDEDDARVLLERSFVGHKERSECFQRLTPQGGIGLVVLLLLRLIDSQLRKIELSRLFQGQTAPHVAALLESMEGVLGSLQLLAEEVGPQLCGPDLLLWDPQRLCLTALQGISSWVALVFEGLMTTMCSQEMGGLLLFPSTHGRRARRGLGPGVGGEGTSLIGIATAVVGEGDTATRYPILQLSTRCVERSCRYMRSLHKEVLSQLARDEDSGGVSRSAFGSPLFDEARLLLVTFSCYYKVGLVPNDTIVNRATPPFRGIQHPPVAMLETIDTIMLLLTSFRSVEGGCVEKVFALIHDAVYVVRCLYSDSHLGAVIRSVEAISREGHIARSEWGADLLKDLLMPQETPIRMVTFLSASAFCGEQGLDVSPSVLSVDLAVSPLRSDFTLTNNHRIEICRAQATAMLRCQGKRWGVAVGRSLFSACSGGAPFIVRLHAASYVSLPFKLYQRNLAGVLAELLDQVRGVDGYMERSRCATSLLAVANACAFAPAIEGDVVSFMLEVFATRNFEFKRMLLDALEYTLGHRSEVLRGVGSGDAVDCRGEGPIGAQELLSRAAEVALRGSTAPPAPFTQITGAHIDRVCFDWIWLHGHHLASFPSQCFGFVTPEAFVTARLGRILPFAIIALHKTTTSNLATTGTSAYLQPQTLPGDDASIVVREEHDASAMDKINDIMRAQADVNTLLRDNFAPIVAFLLLLSRCEDDGGTKPPAGTSLRDYRLTAEKALAWMRVQLGQDLFPELCRRSTEAIIIDALGRCRDTSPSLPFFSFKVLCNAVSSLCEVVGAPSFAALMTAHNGDRAYIVLSAMYRRMQAVGRGELPETMRTMQGLLTGLYGLPCLRIPMVLDATLRVLCYVIRGFEDQRSVACETFKSVWSVVSESKDGLALLQPHFQLVTSFLSIAVKDSPDASQCLKMVTDTFSSAPQLSKARRTESRASPQIAAADPNPLEYQFHFAEPSQVLLGVPESDSIPAQRASLKRGREEVGLATGAPGLLDVTPAHVLHSISTLPATLTRLGGSTPPLSYFQSVSKAIDAQGLFLRNAVIEEVLARESARQHIGASLSFIRGEQLYVTSRVRAQVGIAPSVDGASDCDLLTITETIQRASRHTFLVCVRTDTPLSVRSSALEVLRGLVGCLVEGCATEELGGIDFAPSSTATLEVMASSDGGAAGGTRRAAAMSGARAWTHVDFAAFTLEDNVYNLYCRILAQVRALTVDSDPAVMAIASAVLRDICSDVVTVDSILSAAMSKMRDDHPDEYGKIRPFRREQGPAVRGVRAPNDGSVGWNSCACVAGLPELLGSFPSIPSQELWALAKSNPDAFLRVFTTQLLRDHVVPHFSYLEPFVGLTATSAAFAELYFPLVLLHVSMRKPTDEKERLRKFLATNIDAILRNRDVGLRVFRVLLNAINFLRSARASAIKHFGLHDPTYAQNTATTDDEKRRERATKELRMEFDRLNRTSLVGYRDRLSGLQETLWFPPEHLSLPTLVAASAYCDEWGLCTLFTEMGFEGLDDTPGITATVTYAIGSDSLFGRDTGSGTSAAGGSVAGNSTTYTTRKAARAQRLEQMVKSMHEAVGPALLQCAIRLRDAGLLKQLLFTHKSLMIGTAGASPSSASSTPAHVRELALALGRQRHILLGNTPAAMQADDGGAASFLHSLGLGQRHGSHDYAVRAPMGDVGASRLLGDDPLNDPPGSVTAEILKRLGCPSASYAVARSGRLAEATSEAAWRCGQWDLGEVHRAGRGGGGGDAQLSLGDGGRGAIHRSIHAALCHTFARDAALAGTAAMEGREAIVANLNAFNIVESSMLAQGLREVTLFTRLPRDARGIISRPPSWLTLADNKTDTVTGRLRDYHALQAAREHCAQYSVGLPHFSVVEPLAAIRASLSDMGMPDEWRAAFLSTTAKEAAEGGYPFTALQWVHAFCRKCRSPSVLGESTFAIGRALLLNATGDTESAMQILADLPSLSSSNDGLALLGAWTARNQRVPLHRLVREPLMRQMAMATDNNTFLFASWCDLLMRGAKEALASKSALSTAANLRTIEERSLVMTTRDKGFDAIRKEITAASEKLLVLRADLDLYNETTIVALATCLITGGDGTGGARCGNSNDLHAVYRILHYWLGESATVLSAVAQDRVSHIPPIKFLPVFPQLVVRVVSHAEQKRVHQENALMGESLELLRRVVLGCIGTYPTHCLWYVFSLTHSTDAAKAVVAGELLDELVASRALKPLVAQMVTMVNGYVQQGAVPKDRDMANEGSTLPALVEAATRCSSVPVPTIPSRLTPFSHTGSATLTPHVNGFHSIGATYRILGGLSKPRLVTITMTSGMTTRQIVKAGDDLRQDAVIEQVFALSCTLLAMRSGGTGVVAAAGLRGDPLASLSRGRGMSSAASAWDTHSQQARHYMRTYSVVPIGPGCGLIQFLDNAMPFADYLADDMIGAHRRYYPKELSNSQCRAMMVRNRKTNMTASGKAPLAAFEEVCEGFSPAMHYFYYEHFASPKHWMEARARYVTTAAVSSMVGYIVGLGDRHASNVMVDRETAEVVHIDLGISFDQGQLLPIPEEVPFRLTRDMVDGMGVFGAEGAFRSICEQTLGTMRENRQLLTAVVETFVYDPLARWSIDILDPNAPPPPQLEEGTGNNQGSQVARHQATKSTPLKAHTVLRKTEEKLTGFESGEVLGVPNQVQMLLQKATDPDNLSKMFYGWSSWL